MSTDLFQWLRDGTLDSIIVPDSIWQLGFTSVPLASVQNVWMCSPALMQNRGIVPLAEIGRFNILLQGTSVR